jgi:DNA-binding transcriptional LysR family regulator
LSGLDANLFVVLHALLESLSVTRAARRLGLSPSATSHALARARQLLGDPLLVRAGRQLVPTSRALQLQPGLGQALEGLQTLLVPTAPLDPRQLERAFRVETTDHVQFVLLRQIDGAVRREAPRVNVYLQSLRPDTFARLREGALDLGISVYPGIDADLDHQVLFEDRLVTVVRRGHPALRRRVTLREFAAFDHVLVAPSGTPTGLVDRLLAEHGLRRRVTRTSSTFLDMAFLVAETDDVVSLPGTLARPLLERLGLEILKVPVQLPSFTHTMVWHRRSTDDPSHRWFRELVARCTSTMSRPAPAAAARRRRTVRR